MTFLSLEAPQFPISLQNIAAFQMKLNIFSSFELKNPMSTKLVASDYKVLYMMVSRYSVSFNSRILLHTVDLCQRLLGSKSASTGDFKFQFSWSLKVRLYYCFALKYFQNSDWTSYLEAHLNTIQIEESKPLF